MRNILLFCFLTLSLNLIGQKINRAPKVTSGATVILSESATEMETYAAQVLSRYLSQITGADVPVQDQKERNIKRRQINFYVGSFIGYSSVASFAEEVQSIKDDGFLINIEDGDVFIVGDPNTDGALNGVYYLLEEFLDCRFYSSSQIVIPRKEVISLPDTQSQIVNPSFSYRALHFPEMYTEAYREWNNISFRDDIFGKVGKYTTHTLSVLLPKQLFDKHPEYFALHKEKRTSDHPCLSHPEVYRIVKENLQKEMKRQPSEVYWSVSQPDNGAYCECNQCKKSYKAHGGSQQATILPFVNKLAAAFPDKVLSTLAYSYSVKAPKGITLRDNVNIMLCNYNMNRDLKQSYASRMDPFENLLNSWKILTDNIIVWDYAAQYTHFIAPYPNYYEIQKNLKLYNSYGIVGVYIQGSGRHPSEFDELKSYLFSRLLWDVNADSKEIVQEFVYNYYGNAAKYVYDYINTLSDNFLSSNKNLRMMGTPLDGADSYLSYGKLLEYEKTITQALRTVSGQKKYEDRVRKVLITIQYAILQIHREDYLNVTKGKKTSLKIKERYNRVSALNEDKETQVRLKEFIGNCNMLGIKYINNGGRTTKDYQEFFK